MRFSVLLFILCFAWDSLHPLSAQQTHSSLQKRIIQQMHDRWVGKWYRNLQFEQNVYLYKDGRIVREEVWQELLNSPRNLHIRFNGFETGNGMLFRNDSVYYFSKGAVTRTEERVHHLLLLGFDVYFLQPEETERKLTALGFDLAQSHSKVVEGKKIIVVGTKHPQDDSTAQFWIDEEQLYVVRAILPTKGGVSDIELKNYTMYGQYPVAIEITFKTNKQLVMVEKYFNVSFPKDVDRTVYDLANLKTVRW